MNIEKNISYQEKFNQRIRVWGAAILDYAG
jgi:hypothetical protein